MLDPKEFRTVPTDWIPRLIPGDEWDVISRGVAQRLKAINRFLVDLYCGEQEIVPPDVMYSCQFYNPELQDHHPALGRVCPYLRHRPGSHGKRRHVILEDNLRIPSGITYQLKSTEIAMGVLPEMATGYQVVPYDIRAAYHEMFAFLCEKDDPVCVLLTDSKFGSAFFEHRYLSELLGITLVEGSDLYIGNNGGVGARAMGGNLEVDLIYRPVEDLELFVPGLTEAYLNHKVVLVNAMGTGACDDKLVFLWVPDMIERYLGEDGHTQPGGELRPAYAGQPGIRPAELGRTGAEDATGLRRSWGIHTARPGQGVPQPPGSTADRTTRRVHCPGDAGLLPTSHF